MCGSTTEYDAAPDGCSVPAAEPATILSAGHGTAADTTAVGGSARRAGGTRAAQRRSDTASPARGKRATPTAAPRPLNETRPAPAPIEWDDDLGDLFPDELDGTAGVAVNGSGGGGSLATGGQPPVSWPRWGLGDGAEAHLPASARPHGGVGGMSRNTTPNTFDRCARGGLCLWGGEVCF
jgi:hypothetical protein